MGYLFAVLTIALYVLYIGLLLRMMFDWVRIFSPTWRPRGPVLVVASAVYGVTDWPMNLLRKVVPPLRLGNVALDMGFLILIIAVSFLLNGLQYLTAITSEGIPVR